MDLERARTFLAGLPHVAEAEQFGGLIYWLGDKAIGGKMMAMLNFEGTGHRVSYPAGPERFHELLEHEGLVPAPYMARIHWVSAERWDIFRNAQWEDELRAAHALTLTKLPPKTRRLLELPRA
jgi:predicted DNA-binding protein (MmcQ/YjbR family)